MARLSKSDWLDGMVLATSLDPSDDPLSDWAESAGYECFRGSLDDLIERTCAAAKSLNANHIVRIPGDKILVDPLEVSRVTREHLDTEADYTSNFSRGHPSIRLIPLGLEVEVFSLNALVRAEALNLVISADREHVTSVFYNNANVFSLRYSPSPALAPYSSLRVNLDEPEDLEVLRFIEKNVGLDEDSETCLRWLMANPETHKINSNVVQSPLPE